MRRISLKRAQTMFLADSLPRPACLLLVVLLWTGDDSRLSGSEPAAKSAFASSIKSGRACSETVSAQDLPRLRTQRAEAELMLNGFSLALAQVNCSTACLRAKLQAWRYYRGLIEREDLLLAELVYRTRWLEVKACQADIKACQAILEYELARLE